MPKGMYKGRGRDKAIKRIDRWITSGRWRKEFDIWVEKAKSGDEESYWLAQISTPNYHYPTEKAYAESRLRELPQVR